MKWEQNYVAQAAQQKRIIPGFNIFGYEDAQAVIRAAERAVCPVLLMINRDARTAMAVEHWSALLNAFSRIFECTCWHSSGSLYRNRYPHPCDRQRLYLGYV